MTDNIFINLDKDPVAPAGAKPLLDIVSSRGYWPTGATCASQESDGEILYWSAPPEIVINARPLTDDRGMIAQVGFRYQLDSWYASEEPELATDWNASVINVEDANRIIESNKKARI